MFTLLSKLLVGKLAFLLEYFAFVAMVRMMLIVESVREDRFDLLQSTSHAHVFIEDFECFHQSQFSVL